MYYKRFARIDPKKKKKKKDLLEENEKDLSNEYQLMLKLWLLYKQLLFSMFS